MIGITAYGGYVPYHRLRREEINKEIGGGGGKGERAVASHDEDTATMAVAAALNALGADYGIEMGALYFASTTPPYAEKQSDTLIAGALDLPAAIRTAEMTSTLRAGTTAVMTAADAVANGVGRALVTAADMREGGASGANEATFGDGAAALVLGSEKVLAELIGSAAVAIEILDTWRNQGDSFVRNWDDRYQIELGYGRAIPQVVEALAARVPAFKPADVARVILPAPPKIQEMLLKLGFAQAAIADPMVNEVGLTGAAHPLLMLARELEAAKPGDQILVLGYGEGADALLFRVTDAIANFKPARTVGEMIQSKRNDITYATFLKWRRRIEVEPPRRPEPSRPSSPYMRRKSKFNLGLYGTKCVECSTPQFPAQRVCYKCGTRDKMEDYGFRDKRGRLSTFSADYLTYSLSPPEIVAVVDFDGGGRMLCNMVDVKPEELKIGQTVEMTLRRMFTAGGIHSYFWKAQSLR